MLKLLKGLNWKTLFNIAVMIFSLILMIYFIVSKGGLMDLVKSGVKINLFWVGIALVFHFLNYFMDSYLIYIFVKNSIPSFTLQKAIKVSMVGQFFSAVTPGASGGQPMQIFMMTQLGVNLAVATATQIQKFLVYQSTLVLYSIIAIALRFNYFRTNLESYIWILALIGFITQAIVIFLILLVSFNRTLTHKMLSGCFRILGKIRIVKNPKEKTDSLTKQLDVFHKHNKALLKNPKLLIRAYGFMVILLTVMYIVPYFIYRGFYPDGTESVINMICSQSFVSMVSSLVPTPGASGAAELSFGIFFSNSFSTETMKSAIIVWRTITYFVTLLVGSPYARLSKNLSTAKKESDEYSAKELEEVSKEVQE